MRAYAVEQPAAQYLTAEGQPVQYVTAEGQLVTYAAEPAVQSVQYVQQPAVYNVPPVIFAEAVTRLCHGSEVTGIATREGVRGGSRGFVPRRTVLAKQHGPKEEVRSP